MRKKIFSIIATITLLTSFGTVNSVFASDDSLLNEENEILEQNFTEETDQSNIEFNFEEVDSNTIAEMKLRLKIDNAKSRVLPQVQSASLSGIMAAGLSAAGFNHSGECLSYSLKSLREEPKIFAPNSSLSYDIWTASPDFEKLMRSFLSKAKASGSHEYFLRTYDLVFESPSIQSAISNSRSKKQMDLFGAIHGTTGCNLGVVKTNGVWSVLVIIDDDYDFDEYQFNTLAAVANNIAYIEQEAGMVKPYPIKIYADKHKLMTLPYGMGTW